MENNAPASGLLDAKQAATLLSVSRSTFWKLHNQGRVPLPLRLSPRVVRWSRGDLQAWIAAGCPPRHIWQEKRGA